MRLTESLHFYNREKKPATAYTHFEPTKDDKQSKTLYRKHLKEEKKKKKNGIVDLFACDEE